MAWRENAAKDFPTLMLDPLWPANLPTLPSLAAPPEVGGVGRLAGEVAFQHDAHVSDWTDWQERAAIMEYDGGLNRADALSAAVNVIRLDERRSN